MTRKDVKSAIERTANSLTKPELGGWQSEKSLHCRDCARRVLFFRRVAEIIKDHQHAAGYIAVEALRIVRWNQAVARTPDDQGGQLQLGNPPCEAAVLTLPESIDEGAAVTFTLVDGNGAIHHLGGHAARVAEDIAQALLDEAAGQRVHQQQVNHWQLGETKSDRHRLRMARVAARVDQDKLLHRAGCASAVRHAMAPPR